MIPLLLVVGDYGADELVYYNSPTDYLWNLADSWFFEKYRQNTYIICTGLGPWEEVDETRNIEQPVVIKLPDQFVLS